MRLPIDQTLEPVAIRHVPEPFQTTGRWMRRIPPARWEKWRRSQPKPPEWEWHQAPRWHWFVTLTFLDDLTVGQANSMVRTWAKGLARMSGEHVLLAISISPTPWARRPHVHLLASFCPGFPQPQCEEGEQRWKRLRGGRADVRTYDVDAFGAEYIAKHGGVDIRVACPKRGACRRRGCVHASSWRHSEAVLGGGRGHGPPRE